MPWSERTRRIRRTKTAEPGCYITLDCRRHPFVLHAALLLNSWRKTCWVGGVSCRVTMLTAHKEVQELAVLCNFRQFDTFQRNWDTAISPPPLIYTYTHSPTECVYVRHWIRSNSPHLSLSWCIIWNRNKNYAMNSFHPTPHCSNKHRVSALYLSVSAELASGQHAVVSLYDCDSAQSYTRALQQQ